MVMLSLHISRSSLKPWDPVYLGTRFIISDGFFNSVLHLAWSLKWQHINEASHGNNPIHTAQLILCKSSFCSSLPALYSTPYSFPVAPIITPYVTFDVSHCTLVCLILCISVSLYAQWLSVSAYTTLCGWHKLFGTAYKEWSVIVAVLGF